MKNNEILLDIEMRLTKKQNQYLVNVIELCQQNTPNGLVWEGDELFQETKKLQRDIIGLAICDRERKMTIAKEQLERAFTPRIQKMLENEE